MMNGMLRLTATAGLMLSVLPYCATAQVSGGAGPAGEFVPPKQWKSAVLAVIESDGKLVVSQKNGEFENARAMTPQALLEFLNKWKLEAHRRVAAGRRRA
jgi:hypothetical protein